MRKEYSFLFLFSKVENLFSNFSFSSQKWGKDFQISPTPLEIGENNFKFLFFFSIGLFGLSSHSAGYPPKMMTLFMNSPLHFDQSTRAFPYKHPEGIHWCDSQGVIHWMLKEKTEGIKRTILPVLVEGAIVHTKDIVRVSSSVVHYLFPPWYPKVSTL